MTFAVGTKVGPYEIIALIEAGGMGEVYKARDTRLGCIVEIKKAKERQGLQLIEELDSRDSLFQVLQFSQFLLNFLILHNLRANFLFLVFPLFCLF